MFKTVSMSQDHDISKQRLKRGKKTNKQTNNQTNSSGDVKNFW